MFSGTPRGFQTRVPGPGDGPQQSFLDLSDFHVPNKSGECSLGRRLDFEGIYGLYV